MKKHITEIIKLSIAFALSGKLIDIFEIVICKLILKF